MGERRELTKDKTIVHMGRETKETVWFCGCYMPGDRDYLYSKKHEEKIIERDGDVFKRYICHKNAELAEEKYKKTIIK